MTGNSVAFVATRRVEPGREADYRQWSRQVDEALANASGFVGSEQIPPVPGQQDFWTHVIRFDTKEDSQAWANSGELAGLLKQIESYTTDSEVSAVRTGKADWVNFGLSTKPGPGAPVKWKQLIAGIMVLYPTVVIVHELLAWLVPMPFALSTLATNAVAMSLVMLVWLPQLSKLLRSWLLPTEPLPPARNAGIAGALLVIIALSWAVFSFLFN